MQFKVLSLLTLTLLAAVSATPSNINYYKGEKVISFTSNPELNSLLDTLDIWAQSGNQVKARVNPTQLEALKKANGSKFDFKVEIDDLSKTIQDSIVEINSRAANADFFAAYHNYDELLAFYKGLSTSFPTVVKYNPSIGKSFGGKDLAAVHITNPNGATKKKIYLQSLIHAREWITGSTLSYVINHLVQNRESDPKIKNILDKVEIVAVPIVNPDGYIKTWNGQRLWRKNTHAVAGGDGVDLNRNFPYAWGENGASTSPTSETYRGPSAASEPETKAINAYYNSQGAIAGAIDIHSYSQLVLRPYGTTLNNAPDEAKLKALGEGIKNTIAAVRGTAYVNQKFYELYAASGTASDWFYNTGRKTYGYTIELSPNANTPNGFVLAPSNIIPVGKDILPAIIYFIESVLANPLS